MADHLQIKVSVTPIEELAEEAALETTSIIASEVTAILAGSGDGVDLANYSGSAANQGYTGGTVNYMDAIHTSEGTKLSSTEPLDGVFIKNTGHKFSSVTVLGAATTDCVMVVYKTLAHSAGTQSGWTESSGDSGEIHYFMLGWLKPGQAMVLPGNGTIRSAQTHAFITAGNTYDLSYVNDDASDRGDSQIYCKTFASDGTDASDGNAVEYLAVT